MKVFDKPIQLQKVDDSNRWETVAELHAAINKPRQGNQYLEAGSTRTQRILTFEVRYFRLLEDVSIDFQGYRIVYNNVPYAIEDYDDYMMQHKTVKLLGVSY